MNKCDRCESESENWVEFEEEISFCGRLCPSCARIMFLYLPDIVTEGEVALVSIPYGSYKTALDLSQKWANIEDE